MRLKNKFKKLLIEFSEPYDKITGENFNQYVELAINTRNYLAHENESIPILTADQYEEYVLKTEILLILYLIKRLGWNFENCWLNIKRADRYRMVVK